MSSETHFLSVIVPIYLQERTIKKDLLAINSTLSQIRYDYEIIAVVDGRQTDKSHSIIKKMHLPKLKLLSYRHNHGKGYAIRYGMAHTKGDYIAFIDAGMEINPNGISMLIEHLEWYNADIIVASKKHPASRVKYPFDRRLVSYFAHLLVRLLLNINVNDTQAGLKIFKRKVLLKVLPRLLVKSYAFDIEILSVAHYLGYRKIYEAPLRLNYYFDSLTHATGLKTIYRCLVDTLAVFYRLKILKYYDDHNQRHWKYDPDLDMRVNTGK
ncbi:MAG: glycosyltransferase family 2 protein [Candidatus Shapirobacteria bacterium]|jgi:glycosyltransferase involved in cell wall biosynthesis